MCTCEIVSLRFCCRVTAMLNRLEPIRKERETKFADSVANTVSAIHGNGFAERILVRRHTEARLVADP